MSSTDSRRTLPADYARCLGISFVEDGEWYWQEGCEDCLRRVSPPTDHANMIDPPKIITFECEYLIEP